MKLATLVYYLKRHGLPYGSAAKRRASVKTFQLAFAFYNITADGDPGPETHAAFRYSAKVGHRISAHFKLREFRCGCNGVYHPAGQLTVHRDLVRGLEKARAKVYPGGLAIVSGFRCADFNKRVGGKPDSAHLTGRGADVPPEDGPSAFTDCGFHGIGYRTTHHLVTHVDVQIGLRPNTFFKE